MEGGSIHLWTKNDKYLKNLLPEYKNNIHLYHVWSGDTIPEAMEGDVIVVMGAKNLKVVQGLGVFSKTNAIASLRGFPIKYDKYWFIVTHDPFMLTQQPSVEVDMTWDLYLAHRVFYDNEWSIQVGDYKWVDDLTELINHVDTSAKKVWMSMDLETMGLNPYDNDKHIVSIFFSHKVGQAQGLYLYPEGATDKQKAQVNYLLNSSKVCLVGANLKFDLRWLNVKWGVSCSNFHFDTHLVGSLLHEDVSNSLSTHAKMYCPTLGGYDDYMDKKYDKSKMELIPKEELLQYAGGDVDACLRVAIKMQLALIANPTLKTFYRGLLHPAARAFESIELEGVVIDKAKWDSLYTEFSDQLSKAKDAAQSEFSVWLKSKHVTIKMKSKTKYDWSKLELTRGNLIAEHLFGKPPYGKGLKPKMYSDKTSSPSTTLQHIKMFENNPLVRDFIRSYLIYKKYSKAITTYLNGFGKHLQPDSRFHPTYILGRGSDQYASSGTVSGRLSCKEPSFQTIPKHGDLATRLRTAYVAPKGYKIMNVDFSQIELRVAAEVAEESNMIETYVQGKDIHAMTASKTINMDYDAFVALPKDKKKALRQQAKAINFGFLYGMGANGFKDYAATTYGVEVSVDEAEIFRDAFFKAYPNLLKWHKKCRNIIGVRKEIQSVLGRTRRFPLLKYSAEFKSSFERQGINFTVQSVASDLTLLSIIELRNKHPELKIVGMVHDAIMFYVPENEGGLWGSRVKEVMENLPTATFGWQPTIPIVADIELGYNLAEMTEA